MERKSADSDGTSESLQKDQKTFPKRKKKGVAELAATQISDLSPLSQPETSATKSITTAEGPQNEGPTENDRGQSVSKHIGLRFVALLTAFVPLTLLIIAGNLSPAQEGLGTHQQLGLPPCSMRVLLGVRCPACGMTTSWSYFAKGHWLDSINTNAGGFLLALLCIAIIVIAAHVIRCGRLPSPLIQKTLTMAGVAILIVTLLDWVARLQG